MKSKRRRKKNQMDPKRRPVNIFWFCILGTLRFGKSCELSLETKKTEALVLLFVSCIYRSAKFLCYAFKIKIQYNR